MENSINMDDLGVPLFSETPIWLFGDLNRLTFFLNVANHQEKLTSIWELPTSKHQTAANSR